LGKGQRTKASIEDLDIIQSDVWCYNNGYAWSSSRKTGLHNEIMEYIPKDRKESVDHRDRDKLNNQRSNLRVVSSSLQNINQKIAKDNTSRIKGFFFHKKNNSWSAAWQEEEGKRITKSFAVKKFGFDEAKRLAIEARQNAIQRIPLYRDALNLN